MDGRPALWYRFTLQSCLCPTPELRSFHMGIALTTFSALSNPVRTLSRWLQSTHPAHALPLSLGGALPQTSEPLDGDAGVAGAETETTPARPVPPPGLGIVRPVRGNWPFTVSPPAAEGDKRGSHSIVAGTPPPAGRGGHNTGRVRSRVGCAVPSPERGIRFRRDAGRVVISGRMADVCAELDRMAACEAALHAH